MKHNFKNLNIWKQSINLAIDVYEETENFPKSEEYGLKSHLEKMCGFCSFKHSRRFKPKFK